MGWRNIAVKGPVKNSGKMVPSCHNRLLYTTYTCNEQRHFHSFNQPSMKQSIITTEDHIGAFQLSNGRLIDLSPIREQVSSDEAFIQQLISMFLKSAPVTKVKILQAYEYGDLEQLRLSVHRFKGTLHILGNPALPELAAHIEDMIHAGVSAPDLQDSIWLLDELTSVVLADMEEQLADFQPSEN